MFNNKATLLPWVENKKGGMKNNRNFKGWEF
jgi:hypothetical protein